MKKNSKPAIKNLDDLKAYRSDLEDELNTVEKSISGQFSALRDLLSFQKILQSVVEEISRIKDLITSIIEIIRSLFPSRKKKKRQDPKGDTPPANQPVTE